MALRRNRRHKTRERETMITALTSLLRNRAGNGRSGVGGRYMQCRRDKRKWRASGGRKRGWGDRWLKVKDVNMAKRDLMGGDGGIGRRPLMVCSQWGTRVTSDLVCCCFRSVGVGGSKWLSVLAASGGVIMRPHRLVSCLQLCHLQLEGKGDLAFVSSPRTLSAPSSAQHLPPPN